MPIRIEARYLSWNDLGKRILGKDVNGTPFRGKLDFVAANKDDITIGITSEPGVRTLTTHQTITLNKQKANEGN